MYEIIDSHSHIYPDKIAEKATQTIGQFYGISMHTENGTVSNLLKCGKEAGVSRFVVHSCATTVHQVHPINEFILSQISEHSELIGYITLHPDMDKDAIESEISWSLDNGFKGIKLHPDFQRFFIDEEKAKKIYDAAQGKLPILFHTGDKRFEYSKPHRLANIAREYPNLTVIGAHFGGYTCWEQIDCYKSLGNVYLDTSSSLAFLSKEEAEKIINYFGAQWFFFGVDFPMWKHKEELDRFFNLDLTEEQRKMILAGNIKRVLNI